MLHLYISQKRNGKSRLCIDYGKLNSLTVTDNFPNQIVNDQIDRLHGGKFFISLDIRSDYYQIPVGEECKHFTSFGMNSYCPNGYTIRAV